MCYGAGQLQEQLKKQSQVIQTLPKVEEIQKQTDAGLQDAPLVQEEQEDLALLVEESRKQFYRTKEEEAFAHGDVISRYQPASQGVAGYKARKRDQERAIQEYDKDKQGIVHQTLTHHGLRIKEHWAEQKKKDAEQKKDEEKDKGGADPAISALIKESLGWKLSWGMTNPRYLSAETPAAMDFIRKSRQLERALKDEGNEGYLNKLHLTERSIILDISEQASQLREGILLTFQTMGVAYNEKEDQIDFISHQEAVEKKEQAQNGLEDAHKRFAKARALQEGHNKYFDTYLQGQQSEEMKKLRKAYGAVRQKPFQIQKEETGVTEYQGKEARKVVANVMARKEMVRLMDGAFSGSGDLSYRMALRQVVRGRTVACGEQELEKQEQKLADEEKRLLKEIETKRADNKDYSDDYAKLRSAREAAAGMKGVRRNRKLVEEGKVGEDVFRVMADYKLMHTYGFYEDEMYDQLESAKAPEESVIERKEKINRELERSARFYMDDEHRISFQNQTELPWYKCESGKQGEKEQALKESIQASGNFVHFMPKEMEPIKVRCYVSAADGRMIDTIRALNQTMEDHKEFQGKFYFKYPGFADEERNDTIVFYLDGTKDELFKQFLEKFQENCEKTEGGNPLKEQDQMFAGNRQIRKGLSTAIEPDEAKKTISALRVLKAGRTTEKTQVPYGGTGKIKERYSYNTFLSKLLMMSRGVAGERYLKNHPDKAEEPGLQDPELQKLFSQVFQEFLTASGIDPETMMQEGTKTPVWAE